MYNFTDDQFSRSRYEDMLKEAELRRRYTHIPTEPGILERALIRVRTAWAEIRLSPQARADRARRVGRETLATD